MIIKNVYKDYNKTLEAYSDASDRNKELKKAAEEVETENLALVEDIKALTEKLARSKRM
ncbi:hypothetical protein MMC32_005900, partial [Xylographa parallela]|nr:hypothetical protein [Xylographa parallela]